MPLIPDAPVVAPTYTAPGLSTSHALAPYVPGPTIAAPTVVVPTIKAPYGQPKATVMAPLNPLRGFDINRSKRYPYGAVTQMVRTPTPADVATDPSSNTLANRLMDPWYPAAGTQVPDFSGIPYDWGGYWKSNSILRGW